MYSDVGVAKIYSASVPTHNPLPFATLAGNKLSQKSVGDLSCSTHVWRTHMELKDAQS